jgi:prepilin-type N-terminal cleavage/methylation domain-containing protein
MKQCSKQEEIGVRGFTLVEVLISLGVFGVVSTVLFLILQTGSVLMAKNTGINLTHGSARLGSERLLNLIQSSIASPILVDSSLVPVSGNGPAAGVTFLRLASTSTYTNLNAVTATATTLVLRRAAGMPVPETGDVLVMVGTDNATFLTTNIIGFQASITGVSAINGTDSTITFSSSVGSFCNPVAATGTVLPASAKLFMLDKMACVANGTELRLLNNASIPSSYEVLATLVPKTGETDLLPFKYDTTATPDRRWVDVDLRVESTIYNKRKLGTTNTFFDLKESIAYRSAIMVQN